MTNKEIAAITAAVIAALGSTKPAKKYPAVKTKVSKYAPKLSKAEVTPQADRSLKRRASIGRGFNAKGIKVTFDETSGKFNNVKPYKVWLGEGRVVRRGEHGVKGLFHLSQTDAYVAPTLPSTEGVKVTVLAPQTREHFDNQMAQ